MDSLSGQDFLDLIDALGLEPPSFNVHALSTSVTGQSDESHCVYVVRLDSEVLTKRKFVQANPNRDLEKACLYVGLTGHTPEQRFENHKANYKASRWVRDYGIKLMPHLYTPLNRMSYDVAIEMEVELAEQLRKHGHAVWQH